MRRQKTISAALGAVVLVSLALAGCSGSGASDQSGPMTTEPGVVGPAPVDSGGFEKGGAFEAGGAAGDSAATSADRQVISQGSVAITAENPIDAADDAARIVERAGGRVDSRNEYPAAGPGDDTESADLVVRIPAASLTATLAEIIELGKLEQQQLAATDVTAQSQDLDARITALRTSTGRLTALLATAATTKDLIDIESSLSERQGQLESLESQRRGIADQVDLATVSIGFGSEATAPVDTPDSFLSGVVTGWDSLVGFTGALLVAFGVALPWLVVLAIAGAIVLVVARRRRRTPVGPATIGE